MNGVTIHLVVWSLEQSETCMFYTHGPWYVWQYQEVSVSASITVVCIFIRSLTHSGPRTKHVRGVMCGEKGREWHGH